MQHKDLKLIVLSRPALYSRLHGLGLLPSVERLWLYPILKISIRCTHALSKSASLPHVNASKRGITSLIAEASFSQDPSGFAADAYLQQAETGVDGQNWNGRSHVYYSCVFLFFVVGGGV